MKMNTERFTLTTEDYLAESSALFYLNDAVTQLLEHREEYTQFGIVRYFAEYGGISGRLLLRQGRLKLRAEFNRHRGCIPSFSAQWGESSEAEAEPTEKNEIKMFKKTQGSSPDQKRRFRTNHFSQNFTSVKNGNHVLFREFSYIKATAHNRASFIHIFWKCFRQIGKNGDLLTVLEYSSLLQLLCPDFPADVVQSATRIVLADDALDSLMSLSDFIYSFQIQFYYEEFLESVLVIYEDLLEGKNPNTVIVPTSTSTELLSSTASEEMDTQEGVDSSVFLECIKGLCERFKHKHPSISAISEVLEINPRVSYYSFLSSLTKHEGISQDIGALPNRSDLLVDPEMDQELERLVAQVAISPTSNSSSSAAGLKEPPKKASPRKSLHQRRRIEMESDGSTEETDSSEN